MALINCSMEKRVVVVTANQSNVTSVTLEIIPDTGFVIAARDFAAGANPDPAAIQSITLSDSETTGGPQSDGSYTTNNKVNVVVDFVDAYTPTVSTTFDIDPSGSATADYLIPVKLQGTFVVPGSPDKVTFTPSSVIDFASSPSTTDFYAYSTPGSTVSIMTMTINATTNDFIDEDPTLTISNVTDPTASQDYTITRTNTYDSSDRLITVVYDVKATLPKFDRSGDIITFTGAGEDIPGTDKKIYAYKMNTGDAGTVDISRLLNIYGDEGAQFRIKMERGAISGPTFTIDPTDGIYVFDNTKLTIASAFEPSSSTTTYPSEIDQTDGSYNPATNPYTIGPDGYFSKYINIPEDAADTVYRFTIIPQGDTTIDLSAPGIDTVPDPDTITFDITRKGYSFFEATYSGRSGSTNTIEYFDYLGDSKGSVEPRGRKGKENNSPFGEYEYELVVRDTANNFHLPNEKNSFILSDVNYTASLNNGIILDPIITAELRANSNGFNAGEINTVGSDSHTNANLNDILADIVLTVDQRTALTNKTNFNASTFEDIYSIVGNDKYFKIHFYTVDTVPVYKSQTIFIDNNGEVTGGDENQLNTTTLATPAVDREYLYLSSSDLIIDTWGISGDIVMTHNLDTFAFTTAQTSVTTLDIVFDISHVLREFVNSFASSVEYTSVNSFSISKEVFNTGDLSYSKQNITTTTESVKFTVTGAFLQGADALPVNYNTSNYELLFEKADSSSELNSAALSVQAQPTVTLDDGATIDRKLTIATFSVIIDFGVGGLSSLTSSTSYFMNADIVHRLSNAYKLIDDIESDFGGSRGSSNLPEF
jgi:hypothetical protein